MYVCRMTILVIVVSVFFGIIIGVASASGNKAAPASESKGAESQYDRIEMAEKSLEYARTAKYWVDKDRPIVGYEEKKVLENVRAAIDREIGEGTFPMYCQIPFSAYLTFKWQNRLSREIASRRQDFTVVNRDERPIMIVEYHGSGHWARGKEFTEINDEIKRTVAARSGIKLIEIGAEEPPEAYTQRIVEELRIFMSIGGYAYSQMIRQQACLVQ